MAILHFLTFNFSLPSDMEMTILSIPSWNGPVPEIFYNLGISFPIILENTDSFFRNSSFLTLFISMIFYWIQIGINPSHSTMKDYLTLPKTLFLPFPLRDSKQILPLFSEVPQKKLEHEEPFILRNEKNNNLVAPLDTSTVPFFQLNRGLDNKAGSAKLFFDQKKIEKEINIGTLMMLLSNILIMFLLTFRWIESGHFPLSNLYESLMFLSWASTIIHLLLEVNAFNLNFNVFSLFDGTKESHTFSQRVNHRLNKSNITKDRLESQILKKVIGSVTSPIAFFTNAFATFSLPSEMQKASPLVPALQSNWLMMHVTVMIISYSALIIGSLLSIAFLILISSFSLKIPLFDNNLAAMLSDKVTKGFFSFPLFANKLGREGNNNFAEKKQLLKNSLSSYFFWDKKKPLLEAFQKTEQTKTNPSISEAYTTNTISVYNGFFGENIVTLPKETTNASCAWLQTNHIKSNLLNSSSVPLLMKTKKAAGVGLENNQPNSAKMTLAWNFDNLSYRVLGIGFPFLTIGILSGAVWANEAWGSYWSWDPKETWALLTWLIFAIYLHARITKGWQGKKPAIIASFGLLAIWICFLGVNLIGEGLHSYGWFSK